MIREPPQGPPTLPDGPRVDVVGESFYGNAYTELFGRSDEWRHFDGLIAELVPEPHNEHDPRSTTTTTAQRSAPASWST